MTDVLAPVQPDGLELSRNIDKNFSEILSGRTVDTRSNIINSRGEVRHCELRMTRLPMEGKRILRVSYLDIEDRITAEDNLKKSLQEKEVLLQEVYHRTKNNMQIIASLLNIQTTFLEDEKINEVLQNMISRITAMSLVHEKLYESRDLAMVDFREYLDGLITEIKQAFVFEETSVRIKLKTEPGIFLKLVYLVPCGLAVNELIVNAFKYAFPAGRSGTIWIALSKQNNGGLLLSVKDDGIGLPEDFDFRNEGMIGFHVIVSLIEEQLGGSLSIESDENGTMCKMQLPEKIVVG